MKLKNIAVSGFKSFVDQTNVRFNTQIVGVVGPNGCGKSNVIDAVRWVMGESSAKMLRGESLEDVIFNGSSTRKAVGRASVELVFDNSLGRIKSSYQSFAEIVIKRVLNRDGKSEYRINDKRVRRKDVLDLFRGTGLGPRSYSIIEQGMVSRIVEAKPEELRTYVEEAAGISRYKDKRRETENRIRNTLENIERSEDIRDELLAQLRKLKRQAQAAARYKKLQGKRRKMLALLYRLRFDAYTVQIEEGQQKLNQSTNQLEQKLADQRELEAKIEATRSEQGQSQDELNDIQAAFYQAGADVSKIEQRIEHIKESEAEDAKALAEVNDALAQINVQVETDEAMLAQFKLELDELLPGLISQEKLQKDAQASYEQAREIFAQWQNTSTQHHQQHQAEGNKKQLQLSIIDQINRQQGRADDRQQQLEEESAELNAKLVKSGDQTQLENLKAMQAGHDELKAQLERAQGAIQACVERTSGVKNELTEQRALHSASADRVRSLQEFQTAALSSRHKDYQEWLSDASLSETAHLATKLIIKKGWERAADRIFGPYLNAFIDNSGVHQFWLKPAEHAVTLISIDSVAKSDRAFPLEPLSSYVEGKEADIHALSAGVYVADDAEQAQRYRLELQRGERIVTRDGVLYGSNWVSHVGEAAANTGFLVREEEMHSLETRLRNIEKNILKLVSQLEAAESAEATSQLQVKGFQADLEVSQQSLSDMQQEIAQLSIEQEYTQSRLASVKEELHDIITHGKQERIRLDDAEKTLQDVDQELVHTEANQQKLAERELQVKREIERTNLAYREQQDIVQDKRLAQTRLETSITSLKNNLERMAQQLGQHQQRKDRLFSKNEGGAPQLEALNISLQKRLLEHKQIEEKVLASRDNIAAHENVLRERQTMLSSIKEAVNDTRTAEEKYRMAVQDRQVRQQTMVEEADRDGCSIEAVEIPEKRPDIDACEFDLSEYERKITSIGAVNLVAIDEYESQSERAEYLERQHQDLRDALSTLEKVIRKIDKETRQRFEETFTQLNICFSRYFPKLFGGGRASLSLTSDDFLTTGVTVMAQPPGKRNSTIHLLSGGEKALTAVSLLFALFELNPAPFCMMDEVDAPLDDANVDRFCDTLKSLSEHAQIIVITHNKITMQAATNLIGVTMNEPGVSRVVSVDVEEAMDLVEA